MPSIRINVIGSGSSCPTIAPAVKGSWVPGSPGHLAPSRVSQGSGFTVGRCGWAGQIWRASAVAALHGFQKSGHAHEGRSSLPCWRALRLAKGHSVCAGRVAPRACSQCSSAPGAERAQGMLACVFLPAWRSRSPHPLLLRTGVGTGQTRAGRRCLPALSPSCNAEEPRNIAAQP